MWASGRFSNGNGTNEGRNFFEKAFASNRMVAQPERTAKPHYFQPGGPNRNEIKTVYGGTSSKQWKGKGRNEMRHKR